MSKYSEILGTFKANTLAFNYVNCTKRMNYKPEIKKNEFTAHGYKKYISGLGAYDWVAVYHNGRQAFHCNAEFFFHNFKQVRK